QPDARSRNGAEAADSAERGFGSANFANFEAASYRKYLTLTVWGSGWRGDRIRVYAPDSPFRISNFCRVRERADQRVAFHACYAVRTRCRAIYGSCVRRRPRVDGHPSRPDRSAPREQSLDCSRRLAPKENTRRVSGRSLACFAVGGSAAHGRFAEVRE